MGVPYFAPYIPSPEGRGFTARADKTYAITAEMLGQFRELIKTKMEQFVEENIKAESLAKEFTEKLIGAMNEELYVRAKKAYSNIANANMATAKEAQDEIEQKGVNLIWNLM